MSICPSPSVLPPLQVKLDDEAQKEFDELDAKITDLHISHNTLLRQLVHIQMSVRHLQARAAHIRNSGAPVSRLPPDILAIIFQECRNSPPTWFSFRRALPIEVRLSHVMHSWREVAIGSPSLWSSIRYPILQGEDALSEYLQRSYGRLLDVQLGPRSTYTRFTDVVTTHLTPRIQDFRGLIIDADSFQELNDIVSLFRDVTAPSLKRLKVACRDLSTPLSDCTIFTGGVPLLSEVHVDNIRLILPKSPAVHLSVRHSPGGRNTPDLSSFHRMLTSFPSLTTLHVTGSIGGLDQEFSGSAMELVSLRELYLHGNVPNLAGRVPGLFKIITMPNLESLCLTAFTTTAVASVFNYIIDSYPNFFQKLHTLSLPGSKIPTDVDMYLLRSLPAITNLAVSVDLRTSLMRLLVNSDKQAQMLCTSPLWSELKTLTLFMETQTRVSENGEGGDEAAPTITMLHDFIVGRSALGKPIDMINFSGNHSEFFPPRLRSELVRLRHPVQIQASACKPLDMGGGTNWVVAADHHVHDFRQFKIRQAQFLQFQTQHGISISTAPRHIYINLQNPPQLQPSTMPAIPSTLPHTL